MSKEPISEHMIELHNAQNVYSMLTHVMMGYSDRSSCKYVHVSVRLVRQKDIGMLQQSHLRAFDRSVKDINANGKHSR